MRIRGLASASSVSAAYLLSGLLKMRILQQRWIASVRYSIEKRTAEPRKGALFDCQSGVDIGWISGSLLHDSIAPHIIRLGGQMNKLARITDGPVGGFASDRAIEKVLNLGETLAVTTNLIRENARKIPRNGRNLLTLYQTWWGCEGSRGKSSGTS